MDGLEYEKYCMRWLKKHGYSNIQPTKATGDQGIDILATKHKKRYGFQCKYYTSSVGNDAVQQAFSGAAFYACDVACVITNTSFTKSAIHLADSTDVILYDHVDIPKHHIFTFVTYVIASFVLCFSCFSFLLEMQKSTYIDSHIWTYTFMIVTCLFTYLSSFSYVSTFLSALTCLISVVLYSVYIQQYTLYILFGLTWIFVAMLYSILLAQKEKKHALTIEAQQERKEQLKIQAIQLGTILQEEVQASITFLDLEEDEHTLTFSYRCTKDISSEFALLSYTLNQSASYHQTNKNYTFEKITPHTFKVQIISI